MKHVSKEFRTKLFGGDFHRTDDWGEMHLGLFAVLHIKPSVVNDSGEILYNLFWLSFAIHFLWFSVSLRLHI